MIGNTIKAQVKDFYGNEIKISADVVKDTSSNEKAKYFLKEVLDLIKIPIDFTMIETNAVEKCVAIKVNQKDYILYNNHFLREMHYEIEGENKSSSNGDGFTDSKHFQDDHISDSDIKITSVTQRKPTQSIITPNPSTQVEESSKNINKQNLSGTTVGELGDISDNKNNNTAETTQRRPIQSIITPNPSAQLEEYSKNINKQNLSGTSIGELGGISDSDMNGTSFTPKKPLQSIITPNPSTQAEEWAKKTHKQNLSGTSIGELGEFSDSRNFDFEPLKWETFSVPGIDPPIDKKNNYTNLCIFFHELSHLVLDHLKVGKINEQMELEADSLAGAFMCKAGHAVDVTKYAYNGLEKNKKNAFRMNSARMGFRTEQAKILNRTSGVLLVTEDFEEGVYEGTIHLNKREGFGSFTYLNDSLSFRVKYTGEWKNDTINGFGMMTWTDGTTYSGNWKSNQKDGDGYQISDRDSSFYKGSFKKGLMDGFGTLYFENWGKYVGSFNKDKKEGKGILTLLDGFSYTGNWKDDKENGQGTGTFPDGSIYIGNWKDGKQEGEGECTKINGSISNCPACKKFIGTWKEGKKINGKCFNAKGILLYEGSFKNDVPLNY